MRIVAPLLAQQQQDASNNTNKRVPSTGAPPPEMRRAKSGDHLRRPRSNTSTQPGSVPAEQARQRPSRPPSQIIGEKAVAKHRSTVSANAASPAPGTDAWRAAAEQKFTQEMFEREKSMELIRREKSMDVRLESRLLMEREYRNSMGKPLAGDSHHSHPQQQQQTQRVRSEKSSPRTTPPQSLARNNSGERTSNRNTTINNNNNLNNGSRDSSFNADPSAALNSSNVSTSSASSRVMMPHSASNNSNFSQQQQRHPHEELRRGGSVAAAREGMSYRQVFGLSSSDYLFNVTPPNYTRHRRFSDSDTESLHNFNFIHKVISQPPATGSPSASTNTNTSSSQSTQHLSGTGAMFNSQTPTPSAAPPTMIAGAALGGEDANKSKMQAKKWMKKVRRKSEDNPKRKVVAQLSNK